MSSGAIEDRHGQGGDARLAACAIDVEVVVRAELLDLGQAVPLEDGAINQLVHHGVLGNQHSQGKCNANNYASVNHAQILGVHVRMH